MRVNFYLDAYRYSPDDLYIKFFDSEGIDLLITELGACSKFLLCDRNNVIQFKRLLKRDLETRGSAIVRIRVSADDDDVAIKPLDYNSGELLSIDNFQSFLEIIDNHSHYGEPSRKSKIIEMLLKGSLFEYYFVPEEQEKEKEVTAKKEEKINNNERGSVNMKTNNLFGNIMGKLKFGKIQTDEIAYSIQGIAYKTKDGDYVCYNTETEDLINVSQLILNMPIVVMPLSKKDLKVGDIIQHNNQFVIVKEISDKDIKIIKPNEQETAVIIPMKSIFGFDFYSKVINIFENVSMEANKDNPFGNMLPLLMMGDKENTNSLLPMIMMMNNGNNGNKDISSMLPLLMMSDRENTDSLLPMMMMSSNKDINSMLPLLMMSGEKDMTSILMMMMLNK